MTVFFLAKVTCWVGGNPFLDFMEICPLTLIFSWYGPPPPLLSSYFKLDGLLNKLS